MFRLYSLEHPHVFIRRSGECQQPLLSVHCAVSRSTPSPFSVSASASAESLSASTAGDACPGVGVAHGRVAGYTSTEVNRISRLTPSTPAVPQQPPLGPGPSAFTKHACPLPSPQSPPAPDILPPPRLYLASQTLRRLAELNTPAKYIYISKNTCIHAPQPSPTGSERENPPGA